LAYANLARQQSYFIHRSHKKVDGNYQKWPQPITGFFLKSRVSEICVKQIRVNQGVGVRATSTLFERMNIKLALFAQRGEHFDHFSRS
jgi:hypothetical protein